jgi:hypothetical protein
MSQALSLAGFQATLIGRIWVTPEAGDRAAYHCGYVGCSVRYNSIDGYYMLMGIPNHTYAIDEPGMNTLKCPRHGHWLYRQKNIDAEPGVSWCCDVEGCDYRMRG